MPNDSLMNRNARALAAGQAAWDNMAEPDEPRAGVPMRCVQCGHHFDQSEAEPLEDVMGFACPQCGDNDTKEDTPDYDPPDREVD